MCKQKCDVSDLEVEDAAIALWEALLLGNDPVQQLLIQGEAGDGSQQPAVTWTQEIISFHSPEYMFNVFSTADINDWNVWELEFEVNVFSRSADWHFVWFIKCCLLIGFPSISEKNSCHGLRTSLLNILCFFSEGQDRRRVLTFVFYDCPGVCDRVLAATLGTMLVF